MRQKNRGRTDGQKQYKNKAKEEKKKYTKDTIKTDDKIQANRTYTNAGRKNAIFGLICGLFLWSARRGFCFFSLLLLLLRCDKKNHCNVLMIKFPLLVFPLIFDWMISFPPCALGQQSLAGT